MAAYKQISSPDRDRHGEYTYFHEDIQLLSDIVNRGDFGLGFFDKVVFLLLELLSPFIESRWVDVNVDSEGGGGQQ